MGGAASIEGHDIDYEALKASGVNFAVAYQAIQRKALKGKSANALNDVSIHFLAIRQLSQNLKNQERLEKSRNKILKSRSLPDALKHKRPSVANDDSLLDTMDDLNAHDLAIIVDHEYNNNTLVGSSKKKELVTKPPPAKVVKKPNLFLSVGSDGSLEPVDEVKEEDTNKLNKSLKKGDEVLSKQISPSQYARLSPQGTLHMGKWKIKENGIFLSESIRGGDTFGYGGFGASRSSMPPTAMGSKNDFLLVATLGSGASGVVSEAIHLPTLTLVALKMLPVYNQQKRQHVSRELAVLYKNLADLKLIDDRLNGDAEEVHHKNTCINVLSLYNAFVDPKSGMINLVIEYMDGGSLEDLVVQGGCRDEQVLSDIAYQTCKGLCFLHQHKSVHRDIKPANILCSSNGDIKIADFGISKALDKTTGFAHSFVGTVCYMSPERIVGESYSFSCDIWSLGLTLLAVAKGHFPLSGSEGSDTSNIESPDSRDLKNNAPIGGAGGYWAMIKAICDEQPPSAGEEFSPQFNEFIHSCLKKNPDDRLSAKMLLDTAFVRPTAIAAEASGSEGRPFGMLGSPMRTNLMSPPAASPMSARNATAAAVRRASKEFPTHTPTERLDSKSGEDEDFPYHVRQSIIEDVESTFEADKFEQSNATLVNTIRLEHLDRVLDKIARKLTVKSDDALDPFANAADDDDDMVGDDLDVNHTVVSNSSMESIDKLLFKEVETPEAKKAFRELHDDRRHHPPHGHHHNAHNSSHTGHEMQADDKVNSILKSSSNFKSHHDVNEPHAHPHFDESVSGGLHTHAEDKNGRSKHDSLSRVHFSDIVADSNSNGASSNEKPAPKAAGGARSRLKAPLALQIIDNDAEEEPTPMLPVLPKSSSYFAASGSVANTNGHEKPSPVEPETPVLPVMEPIDYARMLPKLNAEGLPKWEYLAYQLRLPFHLVKAAVKAKLGDLVSLEDLK